MDAQQLMPMVYSALLVAALVMSGALVLTWWLVDRSTVILLLAIYFLLQAFTFAALVLVVGTNPILDIERFRPLIVYGRIAMLTALIMCCYAQMDRIHRRY